MRWFTGIILVGLLTGCGQIDLAREIGKTKIVHFSDKLGKEMVKKGREEIKCPQGTVKVYFIGQVDLETGRNRVGLRCE